MDNLQQARSLMAAGSDDAAREIVEAALRADPHSVEAWQLAVALSPSENTRANARAGLRRALDVQGQPAPIQQSVQVHHSQPVIVNAPVYRPEKDYIGEAFITLLLYYVGAGIIGLIANVIFLSNASRDRRQGVPTRNVGCLQALLIVHLALIGIGCVVLSMLILIPALLVMVGG